MKILLINDAHSTTGGAENYFFDLKARLKQTPGIEVYSIGFGSEEVEGSDFYVFKALSSNIGKLIGRFIPHPILLKRIKRRIAKLKPDIIHLHNIKQYPATVLRAINNYPVVQTIHDCHVICPTSHNIHQDLSICSTGLRKQCFWRHRVKFDPFTYILMTLSWYINNRQIRKVVKAFTAPSPLLADYLKLNKFIPAYYIPPFRKDSPNTEHTNIKENHFLFAGSLATHKGVLLLLEEFANAVKINPALTLDIAGFGPLEKQIQNKITQLNLANHVRLLGWEKNLTVYYQQATALIFPSIWLEAFGLVIAEAMSHGRPIIGVNRGTTAWLVEDGITGLLFDPLKQGDLAEKILYLANHPTIALELGQKGHQRIQKLIDNEAALKHIIKIYHETV